MERGICPIAPLALRLTLCLLTGPRVWPPRVTWCHRSRDQWKFLSYWWCVDAKSLSRTVAEILSLKHLGVMTLTLSGHVTSSVTWPMCGSNGHMSNDRWNRTWSFSIGSLLTPIVLITLLCFLYCSCIPPMPLSIFLFSNFRTFSSFPLLLQQLPYSTTMFPYVCMDLLTIHMWPVLYSSLYFSSVGSVHLHQCISTVLPPSYLWPCFCILDMFFLLELQTSNAIFLLY